MLKGEIRIWSAVCSRQEEVGDGDDVLQTTKELLVKGKGRQRL